MTTKLQKMHLGQSKAQAKGASRAEVVTKGMGKAIAEAMKGATVREKILALFDQNSPTQEQALAELLIESAKQQKAVTATGDTRKRALKVIQASFSRVKRIVKSIIDHYNLDKIKKAKSLDEMYAVSVPKGKKKDQSKGNGKVFTPDQFAEWDARGIRKLDMPIPNTKTATPIELEKYTGTLNRLEQHFVNLCKLLGKHEHQTRIPIRQVLGLVVREKSHLRKAA